VEHHECNGQRRDVGRIRVAPHPARAGSFAGEPQGRAPSALEPAQAGGLVGNIIAGLTELEPRIKYDAGFGCRRGEPERDRRAAPIRRGVGRSVRAGDPKIARTDEFFQCHADQPGSSRIPTRAQRHVPDTIGAHRRR
jgi:hypothetical protein